jgi:hypothetical protein
LAAGPLASPNLAAGPLARQDAGLPGTRDPGLPAREILACRHAGCCLPARRMLACPARRMLACPPCRIPVCHVRSWPAATRNRPHAIVLGWHRPGLLG